METYFFQSHQKPPSGIPFTTNARCVSFDGDADRVLYSYIDEHDKFHLLDGDKIATLVAGHIKKLTEKAGLYL